MFQLRRVIFFMLILGLVVGCNQPTRRFTLQKWSWPTWWKKNDSPQVPSPSTQPRPNPDFGKYFDIRILESTGGNKCWQDAWSYLDETSPSTRNWQIVNRNGIRAGVGQDSDWPAFKSHLEKCHTRVKRHTQIALTNFSTATLLTDGFRRKRTLFYFDMSGNVHGKDFGLTQLQLTITSAGRMPGNRVKIILSPKIIKFKSRIEKLAEQRIQKKKSQPKIVEELENFSITVNLGKNEFVVVGPSSLNPAKQLIGSQLFTRWEKGGLHSFFVLISPVVLDNEKK